jgi:hypothetical protein
MSKAGIAAVYIVTSRSSCIVKTSPGKKAYLIVTYRNSLPPVDLEKQPTF